MKFNRIACIYNQSVLRDGFTSELYFTHCTYVDNISLQRFSKGCGPQRCFIKISLGYKFRNLTGHRTLFPDSLWAQINDLFSGNSLHCNLYPVFNIFILADPVKGLANTIVIDVMCERDPVVVVVVLDFREGVRDCLT